MFNRGTRRNGFTLPEVLVTVAIVAVLAAVVVPAVTQQIGKADAPTFNASLNSLRTAITSFVSDVRAFPGAVADLQSPIANTDFTLSELGNGNSGVAPGTAVAVYTDAQVARWKGPYDNSGITTGVIALGLDWTTTNVLMDSSRYLVVEITKAAGATSVDADALDDLIDDGVATTGIVRYDIAAGTTLDPANKVRLFLMSSAR